MSKIPACFVDANVWFSAARSQTGASFLLMQLAKRGFIKLYANQHVLDEAERNLLLKSPSSLAAYYALLSDTSPIIVQAEVKEKNRDHMAKVVAQTDIPVFMGAMIANADYLISLDKKHIVNQKMRRVQWPFEILLPGEFLQIFRLLH